jgi:hypothetical protein
MVVYAHLKGVTVTPVVIAALVLCVVGGAWLVAPTRIEVVHVLIAVGAGLLAALIVGVRLTRTAARAIGQRQEQGSQRALDAINAVELSVKWSAQELQHGHTPQVPAPIRPNATDGASLIDAELVGQTSETSGRTALGGVDVFEDVELALGALQAEMVRQVIKAHEQSRLVVRHAMFRHIAQREHLLIMNLLAALESLQNQVKAPALLNEIFRIDNLAVRLRRMVDNLAILGGESASAVRRPVTVTNVLRSAIQAVEQYQRARVVHGSHDAKLCLPGHVAPDVTNLVCELIENATVFSPPATVVLVKAEPVSAGLAIEVVDRGETMPKEVLDQANELLAAPHRVDVTAQLADGRLGLLVVGMTAQRHRIHVELSRNPVGGTTALIVLPRELLVLPEPEPEEDFAVQASAPEWPRQSPATRHIPASSSEPAPGGLPRRRSARTAAPLGQAAEGLAPLPVRPATSVAFPAPQGGAAGPASVTDNPGLLGAFRHGQQRGEAEGAPPRSAFTDSE